jgi:peptidyl-prolyl cis-trans isomerase D
MAEEARSQMNGQLFQELQQASRLAARQEMKVKVDYNRARAAIGLEPIEPAGGKAKK